MDNNVTRRDAFKTLATGVAGAVIGVAANPAVASAQRFADQAAVPCDAVQLASFNTAQQMADDIAVPECNPACLATVMHCRSWSRQVYLHVSEQIHGFVTLTPEGFALTAACQAAGRPVATRYWGHEPHWNGGVGRFEGAVVAVDLRDLPGESPSSIS